MRVTMSVRLYGATPELRRYYRRLRCEFGIPRALANLLVIAEMQLAEKRPRRGRPVARGPHVHLRATAGGSQ